MKFFKHSIFCLIITFLVVSYFAAYTPLIVPAIYLFVSTVTFIIYAKDKHAARKENRRVPENTLQLLSFLGGWPGAIIAQEVLRHKTQKLSFQISFWLVTSVNIGGLVWLHTPNGISALVLFIKGLENYLASEPIFNKIYPAIVYILQYQ